MSTESILIIALIVCAALLVATLQALIMAVGKYKLYKDAFRTVMQSVKYQQSKE